LAVALADFDVFFVFSLFVRLIAPLFAVLSLSVGVGPRPWVGLPRGAAAKAGLSGLPVAISPPSPFTVSSA